MDEEGLMACRVGSTSAAAETRGHGANPGGRGHPIGCPPDRFGSGVIAPDLEDFLRGPIMGG